MQGTYLYIDHQSLAPLIHALEDVVDYQLQTHSYNYPKYQLRRSVYQEFLTILNTVYLEKEPLLKHEESRFGLQNSLPETIGLNALEPPNTRKRALDHSHEENSIKTRGRRRLEIEVQLIEWMIGCDKNIFEKKEIVEKYGELCGGGRKQLSTGKLLKMMEKYKLWNVIIRGKNGQQHFLKFDMNTSMATVVKREEFSKDISRALLDQEYPIDPIWDRLPEDPSPEERQEEGQVQPFEYEQTAREAPEIQKDPIQEWKS